MDSGLRLQRVKGMGYHYAHGAFYVLFSEGNMVHMNQLDKLVVSVKIKKEETRWMRQKK